VAAADGPHLSLELAAVAAIGLMPISGLRSLADGSTKSAVPNYRFVRVERLGGSMVRLVEPGSSREELPDD
jgi:hypothetical protein